MTEQVESKPCVKGATFDFMKVAACVAAEPWEEYPEIEDEARMFCLGSWLSLSPSGKIYTPFACSNIAGCAGCNGTGRVKFKQPLRVVKRAQARSKRKRRLWFNRYFSATNGRWPARILVQSRQLNKYMHRFTDVCTRCGGMGSAEAYDDDMWRKYLVAGLEGQGLSLYEYDDMLYAVEYRDEPDASQES